MKKLSLCLVSIVALCLMLTGCGSLDRDLSYTKLTQDDIDYAKSLESGWMKMSVTSYPTSFSTHKTANKFLLIPPVLYLKSFGAGYSEYGLLDMLYVFPLYASAKGSRYDSNGQATASISLLTIAPFFGYVVGEDSPSSMSMDSLTIMPIPIVGINMYGQKVAKRKGEIFAYRYEYFNLPILGSCFATREGPNTGYPTFLWIPYGKEE